MTRHEYQKRTDDGEFGRWRPITDSSPSGDNAISFTVTTGLTNGITYIFRVRAVNQEGGGPESNEVSITPVTIPEVPLNLSASGGDKKVTLTWTLPSNGGSPITEHQYQQRQGSGAFVNWREITNSGEGGTNVISYDVPTLTNGTTYNFRVRAINAEGSGDPSEPDAATPRDPITAPSAPTNLIANSGENKKVTLTWTASDNDGGSAITEHKYQKKVDGTSDWGDWEDILDSGVHRPRGTSYTVIGLTNGITYNFQVKAINGINGSELSSQPSNSESATPVAPNSEPLAPTNLQAIGGDQKIILSWTTPDNGGTSIIEYKYRKKEDSENWGLWTVIDSSANATGFTVTDLTNGTTYHFEVLARNQVGEGDPSATATGKPVGPPLAPTALQATPKNTKVTLTWTLSANDGGYPIIRHEYQQKETTESWPNPSNWTPIDNSGANEASATEHTLEENLTNETSYDFQVRAVNSGGGTELESPEVTVTNVIPRAVIGKPTPPLNLGATRGNTTITLNWEASANNGGSAIIEHQYQQSDEWCSF